MSKSPDLQSYAEEVWQIWLWKKKLVLDLLLNNFHSETANKFHKYILRNGKYHWIERENLKY